MVLCGFHSNLTLSTFCSFVIVSAIMYLGLVGETYVDFIVYFYFVVIAAIRIHYPG